MAATKLLLSSLLLPLFLLPFLLSVALPSHSVPTAVETLWDSGLTAMSLLMEYGGERVTPTMYPSLTVFAAPNSVFDQYGQPSLDQLHLHFLPARLSPQNHRSLHAGTKIQSLAPYQLVVSSSPSGGTLALNGVNITVGSSVYDDGSLVIFKVDGFFDPDFKNPDTDHRNLSCTAPINGGVADPRDGHSFAMAAKALRSRGHSAMASFLDMQVGKVGNGALITVFAPLDESLSGACFNFKEYTSLLLSHISPCKITWRDLAYLDTGAQLQTYTERLKINVTKSGIDLRLNGVPVIERDIFSTNWLVVHGIGGVLFPQQEKGESSLLVLSGNDGKSPGDFIWVFWVSIVSLYFFGLR